MKSKWGRRYMSLSELILSTHGFVYTFVAIYVAVNLLLFLSGAYNEAKRHEDIQRYTTSIARGAGATLNLNLGVVIALASRSAVNFLRRTPLRMVLPIDKAMPDLHRAVGISIVLASFIHCIAHVVTYTVKSIWMPGFGKATYLFVTGVVLWLLILIIRIAARSVVHQASYEVFFRVHVGGSILMYAVLIAHGLHHGVLNTWKWVIGPIILYIFDVTFRFVTEKRSFLLLSKHSAALQGPDIMKIRLPRVFHYEAGQYAELRVPHISRVQWHPFTIASAPHEPEMVFYIKAVGDWTISLYQLFNEIIHNQRQEDVEIYIRGPYGAPAQHVGQFDRVILVGGGVGSTPFCSVVKDVYNWITNWRPQNRTTASRKKAKLGFSRGQNRASQQAYGNRSLHSKTPMSVRRPREAFHVGNGTERVIQREAATPSATDSGSHIFTTNVFSENLESLGVLDDIRRLDREFDEISSSRHRRNRNRNYRSDSTSRTAYPGHRNSSTYTARDYLIPVQPSRSSSVGEASSNSSKTENAVAGNVDDLDFEIVTDRGIHGVQKENTSVMRRSINPFARPSRRDIDDAGMGTYYENSMGTNYRSLDYMNALQSLYDEPTRNSAVFHDSLDLMVAMNFGSVSLVRNMQRRKAQVEKRRSLDRQAPSDRQASQIIDTEDLTMLRSSRVMFLLFMRSVTINMILLWLLLIRFTVTVVASIFGEFEIRRNGIALFEHPALNGVDLFLAASTAILIGIPAVLETIELGLGSMYGFDLCVVLPSAIFDVMLCIFSLTGAGKDIPLLSIFRVFLGWPILTVLILIRLLRVIGERIAQAESLTTTHYTTKAVDFYWTVPTPQDDRWLVKELRPIANIDTVQLHRYLTRTDKATIDLNKTRGQRAAKSLHTNFGRPDWEEIMNEMAESCPNSTTVGVFFCGPRSMGEVVQSACMSAMRNSIVRGLQAGARGMRGLEEVFGEEAVPANEYTGEETQRRGQHTGGCNVKIVFKRETFS